MPGTLQFDLTNKLLEKYSIAVPRYTSYPTAPEWTGKWTEEDYINATKLGNKKKTPVSLYFHLPFCEERCFFCACNVVISKQRKIVSPYIKHIKKEIQLVNNLMDKTRVVQQIHLGGGTPTYFSQDEIKDFFSCVRDNFNISKDCEISAEVDPRVTTLDHLKTLSELGFNRLSMGIQDFSLEVQEAVNRIQPFEITDSLIKNARELGFKSINVDLIYGLPYQTKERFSKTIDLILQLNPDRIALFHYAHLPELIPHQKKYIESKALPSSDVKIEIFQEAVNKLTTNGYIFIGLDHFVKPGDEMAHAKKNKTLHRNFQGYTTKAGCDLYGFGITAISNIQDTYCQNIKKLSPYYDAIDLDKLPLSRGCILNNDDKIRKDVIMKILCDGEVIKSEIEEKYNINFDQYFSHALENLKELENDGLVEGSKIKVTPIGQFFLRNIASVFDYYYERKNGKQRIFSKSI